MALPYTAEVTLVTNQARDRVGIFLCDGFFVFSSEDLGIPGVMTQIIPRTEGMGKSVDNTAANSNVFIDVWELIKDGGWHNNFQFTVKADPDAVFLPDRLQYYLMNPPATAYMYAPPYPTDPSQGVFVTNCDEYPGWHEGWPMMWGPTEVISQGALNQYYANQDFCMTHVKWTTLGEDTFLGKCFRALHVAEIFLKLQDKQCGVETGVTRPLTSAWPDCSDDYFYVFHPHKDYNDWLRCWNDAHHVR